MTDPEKQILTSLRCLPKVQQLIEDERLNEHEHIIYTDGSLKEEQVGCAVVMPSFTLKYRLFSQTTIFNAEMFAILKAMEQLNETNCSRITMTDSLSRSLTALEKVFRSKNSMENKNLNMLAEKGESLKLIWVPAHTGIEGNKAAGEAETDALNEDILPGTKATEME
jgi:ribonuclease HI